MQPADGASAGAGGRHLIRIVNTRAHARRDATEVEVTRVRCSALALWVAADVAGGKGDGPRPLSETFVLPQTKKK